jgi:hypothetical protein
LFIGRERIHVDVDVKLLLEHLNQGGIQNRVVVPASKNIIVDGLPYQVYWQ